MRTLYVGSGARLRARAQWRILLPREVDAQEVDELAAPVEKAGERASAAAVNEVKLDLAYAMPCAHGVDRHADLHAEAVSEWQHMFECLSGERSLPRDGRARLQATTTTNRPASEAKREPKATTGARGKGRNRDVGVPARDCVGERGELDRRVAEITVAENEY
jgi:hypothetical protein